MIKKPAVSIRANRMEFSMSAIRLFEGVQHVLPIHHLEHHYTGVSPVVLI